MVKGNIVEEINERNSENAVLGALVNCEQGQNNYGTFSFEWNESIII